MTHLAPVHNPAFASRPVLTSAEAQAAREMALRKAKWRAERGHNPLLIWKELEETRRCIAELEQVPSSERLAAEEARAEARREDAMLRQWEG